MSFLSHYPSSRILFPMMGGILCGDYFYNIEWANICLPILVGTAFCLWLTFRYRSAIWFGVVSVFFFFVLGWAGISRQLSQVEYSFTAHANLYKVVLLEKPQVKDKTVQCLVELDAEWNSDLYWLSPAKRSRFIFYIGKDSFSEQLVRGDCIWAYTKLVSPEKPNFPYAFNYARYLLHRCISGTAYVPSHHWKKIGHVNGHTFHQYALDCRDRLLDYYRTLGFQGDELAVLSALTLGDKGDLDEDIRETYSVAGASHVLALSGLHVGFIYGLLFFLFAPLVRRYPLCNIPFSCISILLLWIFAFITGMSVSVVRAVTMCSLCILLSFRTEPILTMDTLLAAAFLMLIWQPCWLFDVGFQLSFAAVVSILLFYRTLRDLLPFHQGAISKLWSLMSVSIAAQLGTAPLVLFYFSQFPTHFLLTNLWVVPLVSLIMYAAALLLLLTPFPTLQYLFVDVVATLVHWQNEGLRWIERLPYASISSVWLNIWEVLFFYLFIILVLHLKLRYTYQRLLLCMVVIVSCLTYHTFRSVCTSTQPAICFYTSHEKLAIHCLSQTARSWILTPDTVPDFSYWKRLLGRHWSHLHLDEPEWVSGDCDMAGISVHQNIIMYGGKTVCLIHDNRWKHFQSAHPLTLNYLCITRGYKGDMYDLVSLFCPRVVLLAPSLKGYYREKILRDCLLLGFPCIELPEEGMLTYNL